MRKIFFGLILMVCLLASVQQALAWNGPGHMAIAYTAYQKLTPAERARVGALLKLHPDYAKWTAELPAGTTGAKRELYLFMLASTWPDELRDPATGYSGPNNPPAGEDPAQNVGFEDKNAYKYWHYTDVAFTQDGTPLPVFPGPSAVDKIPVFRAGLASGIPDVVKSYDLVWVTHLVGDIHQPLHAVARITKDKPAGDAGGNLVKLEGKVKNLHSFWDSAAGDGGFHDLNKAVELARKLPKASAAKAKEGDAQHWLAESVAVAKSKVYSGPIGDGLGPFTLTPEYVQQAEVVSRQRMVLAGARLAVLLKSSLGCGRQRCSQ